MRAADRFAAGVRQIDIARELGVAHQTVSDWHALWKRGGKDALRRAGRAGRRPKLSAEQLVDVETALAKGPKANGYATELWTLARVAEVIEAVAGCATTLATCGASCASSWAGPGSGRPGGRWSATTRPSTAGSSSGGPR